MPKSWYLSEFLAPNSNFYERSKSLKIHILLEFSGGWPNTIYMVFFKSQTITANFFQIFPEWEHRKNSQNHEKPHISRYFGFFLYEYVY